MYMYVQYIYVKKWTNKYYALPSVFSYKCMNMDKTLAYAGYVFGGLGGMNLD